MRKTAATMADDNIVRPKAVVAAMRAFAENTNTTGVDGLIEVFSTIQQRGPHPPKMTVTAQMRNRTKCRYFDVPCLDETRVVLKPWPDAHGDFIHANWISHELINNRLICTQGPLDSTNGDFWRMVWQENVDTVLMLCRVNEAGKVKCSQYWPKSIGETKSFYGITIKNDGIRNNNPDVWCTDLSVSYKGERRKVMHYQWVTWPDRFVPKQLVVPFMMLSLIRTCKTPTIIHCSAGIGRTGTLVVLEIVIRSLLFGYDLSIPDIIWSIRSQRSSCVQCEEQFLYIHYILIQRFLNKGILSESIVRNFCREYEHYYYAKTHVVQVPLPIFARKPLSEHVDKRRTIAKTMTAGTVDENAKHTSRPKIAPACDKYLAGIRNASKKRAQIGKPKKISRDVLDEEEGATAGIVSKEVMARPLESKEPAIGTTINPAEVEKALAHAAELVNNLLVSNKPSREIQQQQQQALQALEQAYKQAKLALELKLRQTPSFLSTASAAPLKPQSLSSPLASVKTAEQVAKSTPQFPLTARSPAKPSSPVSAKMIKMKEKEGTAATSTANMAIENADADGEEDDDVVASYYFMQPEWPEANNPPTERSTNELQEKNRLFLMDFAKRSPSK
uniref:Receptor-type tyrosine-protein phosphatase S n=1 Tax=Ascaris suum TaxID=6253 RepID=F1KUA4_ASCSU